MTIAGRNRFLILSICITALLTIGGIICCVILITQNSIGELPLPPKSSFWLMQQPFLSYSNYAAVIGTAAFPLMSAVILAYIFFLFEKTTALEISFFSLFIFALSLEVVRLMFPLQAAYPLLTVVIAPIARGLFFFRFSAYLSLLTASLFAHQTFTRETGSVIFLLSFISFSLAHTIPINTGRTLSFFLFTETYRYLLYSFDGIICVLSVISFLFIGIFRSIPEYYKAALWLLLLLAAYTALLYAGSWLFTIAGIAGFLCGAFGFIRTLHQFYLWQ
ncbi:MAG: hypothetical protein P1P65_07935 [Treponema sp.]